MAFKTLLTVTGPALGNDDLKLAASLCQDLGAHLSTLVVQTAAPPPVGEFAAMVSDVWLEERREDTLRLEARCKQVNEFIAANTRSADVIAEYPELAWADEAIGRRGRYADITVLGPDVLKTQTLKEKTIEGALFSSGKPLLIVPDSIGATLRPKRVMVAWDARIEVSRAVREAVELLAAAEEVRLVLVDPVEGEDTHGAEPGADVAAYLVRHGVKISVDRLPGMGSSVATVLNRHAIDCAADMLVMGAYGHSRLRQWIFGGVTSFMLDETPLPLFLSR